MNSVHDLGGSEGFGSIHPEPEDIEPIFHNWWEGRVYALVRMLGLFGLWNIDMSRHARERLHPVDYLRNSYYENWLAGLETQLFESGLVTMEELLEGIAKGPAQKELRERVLLPSDVKNTPLVRMSYFRDTDAIPKFKVGDAVRAINQHPTSHTPEPRYVRGHSGVVHEHYGAQVFPDLSVKGVDEGHHLYSVRFEASELWGADGASNTAVYVDLWEDYLEKSI